MRRAGVERHWILDPDKPEVIVYNLIGGPVEVLLAGRRFERFDTFPLILVLLNSDSVTVLLDKVARLNRYFHSRHRHRILDQDEGFLELEHVSMHGPAPQPVESLFVAGLYLAMFEQIGCIGMHGGFPDSPADGWVFADGATADVPATDTGRWRFEWDGFEVRRSLPGLDDLILREPGRDLEQGPVSARVSTLVGSDLTRRWRVGDVADQLLMSSRTLQRSLHNEGTSLTRILAESRLATARRLLIDTDHQITDIGYMLGFSDTLHFTRTFAAATGAPPLQWRHGELTAARSDTWRRSSRGRRRHTSPPRPPSVAS